MAERSPARGEIWYVHTPGQPDDPHQPRPALVLSGDTRNRLSDDLIVVPVFSTGWLGPTRVAAPAGTGGLPYDSVLFCDEITTVHQSFLGDRPLGATVPDAVLDQVVRAARRALGEVVPDP